MATKLRDDTRLDVVVHERRKLRVLPAIVVYGANASGKSNLLQSIRFMRGFVRNSHTQATEPLGITRHFFQLAANKENEPSQLDCDFMLNEVRYHYGFEFDNERVRREWLYSFPDNRRNIQFVRESGKPMYFGPNFAEKGKARTVETLKRENSLFLSAAAQNNLTIASDISEWFKSSINIDRTNSNILDPSTLSEYLEDETVRQRILEFIKNADPTITDIRVIERETAEDVAPVINEMRAVLKKHFAEANIPEMPSSQKEYQLVHSGQSGVVAFPSRLESNGTVKLLHILGPMLKCLARGNFLISDELESSLHVIIATELLMMFNSIQTNRHGAQILVATHDTNLLDIRCLRRDQIWFAEKSPVGATHLYSLAELSVRKSDSIKRGYLQGRFGAIPFLPSADVVHELV